MFVRRVEVPEDVSGDPRERRAWPYTIPAVADLAAPGLTFMRPVTFLVGDNGTGKSTVVEALAEAFGLDAYGGRARSRRGSPDAPATTLGSVLRLETSAAGSRLMTASRKTTNAFFLRAETAFSMTERLGGVPGYWNENTAEMSHGEGFLAVFRAMFADPGFYVMDEPESALSFTACLHLVRLMHELGESGSQVVCATHSPILASTPDADIIELGDHGMRRTSWEDLEIVEHWRRYLNGPEAYLRHLLAPEGEQP